MSPEVDIGQKALEQIQELATASGESVETRIDKAIHVAHRTGIGPDRRHVAVPFKKRWSNNDAEILLRQVSPTNFQLEEAFRFVPPDGEEIIVHRGDRTDLASVPHQ